MTNPLNPRQTFAATTSRTWLTMPPAADALSQVKDGNPMDAGTWCIVEQNANVALDIAPRPLECPLGSQSFGQLRAPVHRQGGLADRLGQRRVRAHELAIISLQLQLRPSDTNGKDTESKCLKDA
jgi:hypothetical protein